MVDRLASLLRRRSRPAPRWRYHLLPRLGSDAVEVVHHRIIAQRQFTAESLRVEILEAPPGCEPGMEVCSPTLGAPAGRISAGGAVK